MQILYDDRQDLLNLRLDQRTQEVINRRLSRPRHNEKDLDDLPEEVRGKMSFILVDTMDEVLKAALGDGFDRAVCE